MALSGRHEWKMNMSGTSQENRTRADTVEEEKKMKKNTYEAVMWQHDDEPLCYAIWSDNNLVQTLSNFHTPKVVDAGVKRKRRVQGTRERTPVLVLYPQQNIDYSETFHLIDRGNGAEANYDLAGQSKKHEWSPKLSLRLFNVNFNNSYMIYLALMAKHNPRRRILSLSERIKEATHSFLQVGLETRKQKPEYPSSVRDLRNAHDSGSRRKKKKDAKGDVCAERSPSIMPVLPLTKLCKLKGQ